MPEVVKPEDIELIYVKVGKESKYADIFNYQVALLKDPKRAASEAVRYTAEDGVDKNNWGQIATGLRNVGKKLGVKLAIVYREEKKPGSSKLHPYLYVKHNGEYVPMTEEQVAARKAARDEKRAKDDAEKLAAELLELSALSEDDRTAVAEWSAAVDVIEAEAEVNAEAEAALAATAAS